jgi:GT2 family glycosyltransferase
MATFGRPANLAELVPAVLADQAVRHFVVVVDGEDPESASVLSLLQGRFDRLVFAQTPHAGQLRALETGVDLTDAEVVFLLDDDVMPTAGLAGRHARAHANDEGLVVVGTMPVELPPRRADIGSLLYARDYLGHCARIESGESQVLDNLWLGNVSIRRSDCLSVGLYSADFTASYHADQDLGFRLAEAGLVGRYDPSLVAAHRHRRSDVAFLHDARRRGASLAHLHQVHASRLGPFDPATFTDHLPAPLRALVRRVGSRPTAPGIARALLGLAAVPRALGWDAGPVALAQLARRIAFVWGAAAGEDQIPEQARGPRLGVVRADRSQARPGGRCEDEAVGQLASG